MVVVYSTNSEGELVVAVSISVIPGARVDVISDTESSEELVGLDPGTRTTTINTLLNASITVDDVVSCLVNVTKVVVVIGAVPV